MHEAALRPHHRPGHRQRRARTVRHRPRGAEERQRPPARHLPGLPGDQPAGRELLQQLRPAAERRGRRGPGHPREGRTGPARPGEAAAERGY